ncbi:MAG: peptidoglycan DD-metalloendopeptidase family protein [Saprospiraceae bacterium]|nr:peptidoglycan DD-metalloendopeptidase family protein [Saprospiraceae bacterium]
MNDNFDNTTDKKRSITEKYRLAVIDEENLSEVRSFRVSLLNIYIWISTILLLLGIGIISIIFFTPVKRMVPGYADVEQNRQYLTLKDRVAEIEEALEVQQLYNESLKKIIQGEDNKNVLTDSKGEIIKLPGINDAEADPAIISAEDIDNTRITKVLGSLFFVPPVTGTISSGFLDVKSHYGVDILAARNTPIKSIMSGVVVFSDWTMEAGNTMVIQHDNNIVSVYKHNSELLKKSGDLVQSGEAIAIIGNTGTLSDGPHLHLELWYDGYPVDPEKYINFN